jgi:hypothetical protein
MPTTDVGIGSGTYNPVKVAGTKGGAKAGAGESKCGIGLGGGGIGSAMMGAIQEDEAALETGFILDVWDPVLMQVLWSEI